MNSNTLNSNIINTWPNSIIEYILFKY